jgi:hypothetical protein
MAIKRFVSEQSERKRLIDEFREVLVSGSSRSVKGVGTFDVGGYLAFFLSLGNTAYRYGDVDVFEHYLRSLFEVVEAGLGGMDYAGLVERVRGFGIRSIRDYDLDMFGAVVEVVAERVFSMRDVGEIGGQLEFLQDLGLYSAETGFDGGVLAVVNVFRLLGVHFVDEGLGVSSMSLKNRVVGLVHYLGALGDESLRGSVISLVEGVLAPSTGSAETLVDDNVSTESSPVA